MFDVGLFELGLRDVFGEDGGVGAVEHDAAAGFGDLGEPGFVGVGVALLDGELGLDAQREGFLFFVCDVGEEVVDVGAVEGELDLAGGEAGERGAVLAGGVGELGEFGGGEGFGI